MARTRSPLETAIIAWIALKVVGLLLGFGLTVEALSNPSKVALVNPDVGRAIGYVSIALLVLILLLLLAERRYLIAAVLVGIVVAVPLVLQSHKLSLTVRPPIRGGIVGHRLGPVLKRPLVIQHQSPASSAAAIPVVDLYNAVLPDSATLPGGLIVAKRKSVCRNMTPRARAELELAFLNRRSSSANGCGQALLVAAHAGAFGRPRLDTASLLRRIYVSAEAQRAGFLAGNGIRLELVAATRGGWRIDRFVGSAFVGR